jgi:prepilin-type N-terminal cleavage/methylation domain-containing protein
MSKKYKKGFTLIELVVSIAIASIITLMLYSIFQYNLKAYNKTTDAMNEQANLRLVSYKLTNQLRNIGYIDLDNNVTPPASPTDSYIYIDSNQIKLTNAGGTSTFVENIISDVEFGLSRNELERYVLTVHVSGDVHSYTTDILLNNIVDDSQFKDSDSVADLTGTFNSIQFNYSRPPLTMPNREVVKYEDLALVYPDDTIKKGTTFSYTPVATGGVSPYIYTIFDVTAESGDADVSGGTITWTNLNQLNDKLYFSVRVTDAAFETCEVGFTITIKNN